MSEFQDFLKRTVAYVAIGEFKSGKFEAAQELYEQAVATYGEGFQGTFLLREPGSDRGISIIFWDDAADMEEGTHTATHEQLMKKMAPLFAAPPTTGLYELVCNIDPPSKADSAESP
ncbi:MAG: antibiotic biosynthesis monooxygenase [Oculatellaceae cyanobacterium Prado106]|jgi:heme-degrading monooxygenase HmoA|nr:antibiotic biosynthesis monooxygenase [Oculatellaceae cyanobacterium Prado106]